MSFDLGGENKYKVLVTHRFSKETLCLLLQNDYLTKKPLKGYADYSEIEK
jgi:hypothetical protein